MLEEEGAFWEPEPVFKMHYQVTLGDGRLLGIFRNMKTGGWYKATKAGAADQEG